MKLKNNTCHCRQNNLTLVYQIQRANFETGVHDQIINIMPYKCVVPGCDSLGGYRFPKDPELSVKWRIAVKKSSEKSSENAKVMILWKPTESSRVCQAHFKPEDFKETLTAMYSANPKTQKVRPLKDGVVPSIFPWTANQEPEPSASTSTSESTSHQDSSHDFTLPRETVVDVDVLVEIVQSDNSSNPPIECGPTVECTSSSVVDCQPPAECSLTRATDCGIQVQVDSTERGAQTRQTGEVKRGFSIQDIKDRPDAIKYYTSFVSYKHFSWVLYCLGPSAYHLDYKSQSLTTEDEFFLFMMKIRLNHDDEDLSHRFNISKTVVGSIFHTWLQYIFFQLQELVQFKEFSQEINQQHMPKDFKAKYPTTRVILDATKIEVSLR